MKLTHVLVAATFAIGFAAHAQQAAAPVDHATHHAGTGTTTTELLSQGEVRKVDPAQGKITLRHGPLSNLDMPAMTMVFTATDKKLLDGVKEHDKVKFTADKKDGAFVVTALQVVR